MDVLNMCMSLPNGFNAKLPDQTKSDGLADPRVARTVLTIQ